MKPKSKSPAKPNHAKSNKAPVVPLKPPGAKQAKTAAPVADQRPSSQRQPTKIQQCLDLLTRRDGATIEELMAATGWQTHSVRGFLAGTVKKKLGLTLDSAKVENGARHYRVIAAEAGAR